jgi:hypothetical protein
MRRARRPDLLFVALVAGFAGLAGLIAASPARAGVEVRATLQPKVIGVDETVTLTIEVRSDGFDRLGFRPDFELDNLEIVGGPYEQEDIRFTNGDLSRAFRLYWRLRPTTTGPARVWALSIRLGGRQVAIGEREIQVQEEPTGTGRSWEDEREEDESQDPLERLFGHNPFFRDRNESPAAFLRADVRPQHPYAGEQVLYTVHLYTRQDILAATAREVPKFKGFWVRDVPQPQRLPTDIVDIDGARYSRVVLLQKALFPLRPGRHLVEPTAMDLMVRTVERRFFGPPVSRPEQLSLRTDPKMVDVRPLPPAPAGFGGAVGDLSLAAHLEPGEIRLGEAATLTLTLSGEGNLQGVQQPEVTPTAGLEVLPPQQQGDEKVQGTEVHGSRTWSFVVIPGRTGRHTVQVPPVSFFDPETGRYRTAAVSPVDLTALPRAPQPGGLEPSLHGIRSAAFAANAGGLGGIGSIAGLRWPALLPWLFGVPWALTLLVVVLARRRPGLDQGPRATGPAPGSGVRSAAARLQQRLAETGSESRPRQAAAQIEEAWREFLAARWEVPPATPAMKWSALLAERDADAEATRELAQLVDDLHYLRFAPQLSSTETLRGEALDRCRRLSRRLR